MKSSASAVRDYREQQKSIPIHPSVRSALRDRTSAIHEALHEAAPFTAIAEGRLSLDGYIRLVLAVSHFHSSLTFAVQAACRALDFAELEAACALRRRQIAHDLAVLDGGSIGAAAPAVAAIGETWAVGCLYTLVGSTLGGKLIYRQLDYLLPTPAGRSFFAGTAQDGSRWREFCDRLEAFTAEPGSLTELTEGAHFAFRHFALCLERHL